MITGEGLECVITLGTGLGFALFEDGRPAPHLELRHHPVHKGRTYDEWLGKAALRKARRKRWNRRVGKAVEFISTPVSYDTLAVGGGNATYIRFELPPNVRIVPNEAGITGGVRLWDPTLDLLFEPMKEHVPRND